MAATSFSAALEETLRHEGGFVHHPLDPGGPTNLGITQATLASHRGKPVSRAEVIALRPPEAAEIYRARYWNAVRGDELPAGVDLAVFDLAVNSGPGRAIRILQQALDVPVDGRLGPATLAAVGNCTPTALITSLSDRRLAFLRRPSGWPVFGRGWERRVRSVLAAAQRHAERAGQSAAKQQSHPKPRPPLPLSHQENDMLNDTKSILSSRTVWANMIGLAACGLGFLGIETGSIDQDALVNALLGIVTGGSFIASTIFRIRAEHRLR